MKIRIDDAFIETDNESVDSLIKIHDGLQTKTNAIKDSLASAKAELISSGEYADPDWFRRAKHALRSSAHAKQVLIREIASKKANLRRAEGVSFERMFIHVAKSVLDDVIYREIIAEAKARLES